MWYLYTFFANSARNISFITPLFHVDEEFVTFFILMHKVFVYLKSFKMVMEYWLISIFLPLAVHVFFALRMNYECVASHMPEMRHFVCMNVMQTEMLMTMPVATERYGRTSSNIVCRVTDGTKE